MGHETPWSLITLEESNSKVVPLYNFLVGCDFCQLFYVRESPRYPKVLHNSQPIIDHDP